MRLLRRPVSLMYALGLLSMGVAVGILFADDLRAWSGSLTWGLMIVGALLILGDAISRQVDAARRGGMHGKR